MPRRHTTGFSVLGFESDPTPGKPDLILAEVVPTFTAVGDDAEAAYNAINSGAMANGKGQAMDALRKKIGDSYPPKLQKTAESFHAAADAFRIYADALADAQSQIDRAMDRAGPVAALATSTLPPLPADASLELQNSSRAQQGRIDEAAAELGAAKRLAQDAKEMRDRAAATFDSTLRAVGTVPERSFFEKIADFFADNPFIQIIISVVVGLVSLVFPVVGLALGAVVFGLTTALTTVATGEFDIGSFVVGLVGVALGGLGLAAKALPGLGNLAKLGSGVKAGLGKVPFFTTRTGNVADDIANQTADIGAVAASGGSRVGEFVRAGGRITSEAAQEFAVEAAGGAAASLINGEELDAQEIAIGGAIGAAVGGGIAGVGNAGRAFGGRRGGGGGGADGPDPLADDGGTRGLDGDLSDDSLTGGDAPGTAAGGGGAPATVPPGGGGPGRPGPGGSPGGAGTEGRQAAVPGGPLDDPGASGAVAPSPAAGVPPIPFKGSPGAGPAGDGPATPPPPVPVSQDGAPLGDQPSSAGLDSAPARSPDSAPAPTPAPTSTPAGLAGDPAGSDPVPGGPSGSTPAPAPRSAPVGGAGIVGDTAGSDAVPGGLSGSSPAATPTPIPAPAGGAVPVADSAGSDPVPGGSPGSPPAPSPAAGAVPAVDSGGSDPAAGGSVGSSPTLGGETSPVPGDTRASTPAPTPTPDGGAGPAVDADSGRGVESGSGDGGGGAGRGTESRPGPGSDGSGGGREADSGSDVGPDRTGDGGASAGGGPGRDPVPGSDDAGPGTGSDTDSGADGDTDAGVDGDTDVGAGDGGRSGQGPASEPGSGSDGSGGSGPAGDGGSGGGTDGGPVPGSGDAGSGGGSGPDVVPIAVDGGGGSGPSGGVDGSGSDAVGPPTFPPPTPVRGGSSDPDPGASSGGGSGSDGAPPVTFTGDGLNPATAAAAGAPLAAGAGLAALGRSRGGLGPGNDGPSGTGRDPGPSSGADRGPTSDRSPGGGGSGPGGSGPGGGPVAKDVRADFPKGSHDLTPAARADIDRFADQQKGAIARALLGGKQLPRFEVEGRGRNNPEAPGSRAAQRGDAARQAFEDRLRDGGTVAPFVSDVLSGPMQTGGGRLGFSSNRTASINETAPPPPREVMGAAGPDAHPVPKELHVAWFGGTMPQDGAKNLADWVQRAKDAGWKVNLYTDDSAVAANRDLFDRLGKETGPDGTPVVSTSSDPAGDLGIDRNSGAGKLLSLAEDRGIHTMKSDIVRYQALHDKGGVYIDTDIAPGDIDLTREPPAMDQNTVPLLGPGFRDQKSLDSTKAQLAELQDLAAVPDSAMPSPAEFRWRMGSFGNALIVAPAGSGFIGNALDGMKISDRLADQIRISDQSNPPPEVVQAAENGARADLKLGDTPAAELSQEQRAQLDAARQERLDKIQSAAADNVKKSPAQITGPLYLNRLISEHVGGQLGIDPSAMRGMAGFRMGDWQVAPGAAGYFGGLDFVTSSSDIKFDDSVPEVPGPSSTVGPG